MAAQVQTCSLTAPGCEAFLSEHGVFEPYDTVGALCRQKIFFPNPSGTLYCNNSTTHQTPYITVIIRKLHTSTHYHTLNNTDIKCLKRHITHVLSVYTLQLTYE